MMRKSYFDSVTFNSIKGIAIILLFVLHFFASSDLWLPEFCVPSFQVFEKYFSHSLNMCIAMFAFLSGYGFWFNSEKNYSHSAHKAFKVLSVYWKIYFLLFIIAVLTGLYSEFSLENIGLVLIGLDNIHVVGDIIAFHWYLAFYLAIIFLMPAFQYLLARYNNILRDMFYLVIVPVLLFSFFGKLSSSFYCLQRFFVDLILWFPCVGVGYVAARYAVFEMFDICFYKACKRRVRCFRFIISSIIIILTFYGMYRCPGMVYTIKSAWILPIVINMSAFYILFFIYALTGFLRSIQNYLIQTMLSALGRDSLYMWLLNGIFFNVFKAYTQPILLYPKYALLILIWGLFICFMLTRVLVSFER